MFEDQELNWKQIIIVAAFLLVGFALVFISYRQGLLGKLPGLSALSPHPTDEEIIANLSASYGTVTVMHIVGSSMYPSFVNGQKVFVATEYYTNNTPRVGDVSTITFKKTPTPYVKRVAFVQGDTLVQSGGAHYLKQATARSNSTKLVLSPNDILYKQLSAYNYQVPNGTVIVLGDNLLDSDDSRSFGLVSTSQLSGKVVK